MNLFSIPSFLSHPHLPPLPPRPKANTSSPLTNKPTSTSSSNKIATKRAESSGRRSKKATTGNSESANYLSNGTGKIGTVHRARGMGRRRRLRMRNMRGLNNGTTEGGWNLVILLCAVSELDVLAMNTGLARALRACILLFCKEIV